MYTTMPSFIKIGSGIMAPRGMAICLFPMLSTMAFITGYRPTCDYKYLVWLGFDVWSITYVALSSSLHT